MTSPFPGSAAALCQQLTPPTAATGGEVGRAAGSSNATTTASPIFSFAIRREDNHPFIIVSSSDEDDDEVDSSYPPYADHMKRDHQQHCHEEESDDEVTFIRSGDYASSRPRASSLLPLSSSSPPPRSSCPRSVDEEEALSRPVPTSSSSTSASTIPTISSVAIPATSQRLSQRESPSSPCITDTYYGVHSGASPVRGDHQQQQQQPLMLGTSLPASATPCLPPLTPPAATTTAVVPPAASVPRLLAVPAGSREGLSCLRESLAPLYSRDAFYTREGFESCLHMCFPSSQWLSPGEFWGSVPPEEVRYLGEGSFGLAWRVSSVFLKRHLEHRELDDGREVDEETQHHHHHHQTATAAGAAYYSTSSSTTTPTTTGATQKRRRMEHFERRAKASGVLLSTAMDERDAVNPDDDSSKKKRFVCIKASPIRLHSRAAREDAITVLRELRVLQFLQQHPDQAPHTVPLYAAYYVPGTSECLPPHVYEAVRSRSSAAATLSPDRKRPRGGDETDAVPSALSPSDDTVATSAMDLPSLQSLRPDEALAADGTIFLLMHCCDGNLTQLHRHSTQHHGSLPSHVLHRTALAVSAALSQLHSLGVVHLDVKPDNILYEREDVGEGAENEEEASSVSYRIYLSDFGNCRLAGGRGKAFGSYPYADLPALRAGLYAPATDCFALGASLYELSQSCCASPSQSTAAAAVSSVYGQPLTSVPPLTATDIETKSANWFHRRALQVWRAVEEEQRRKEEAAVTPTPNSGGVSVGRFNSASSCIIAPSILQHMYTYAVKNQSSAAHWLIPTLEGLLTKSWEGRLTAEEVKELLTKAAKE